MVTDPEPEKILFPGRKRRRRIKQPRAVFKVFKFLKFLNAIFYIPY